MDKRMLSFIVGSFLIFSGDAIAHSLPTDAKPISTILQNLQNSGYTTIYKIKYDDNVYEVKGYNALGKEVKLEIDPKSGNILKPKDEVNSQLSILDAAKKVETAGYTEIVKIEAEDNGFEVKALDKDGKKVELLVDAKSGNISKD